MKFQYLKILLPGPEEQKEIANRIRIAQDEVNLINQKIQKLKKIKSSIMEKFFPADIIGYE